MSRVRLVPRGGIGPGSPQNTFAKAVATHLARHGFDQAGALPAAITILAAAQRVLDSGRFRAGADYLDEDCRKMDNWWLRYHPRSKHAGAGRAPIYRG